MQRRFIKKLLSTLIAASCVISMTGCSSLLIEQEEVIKPKEEFSNESQLGVNYYVWHNDGTSDYSFSQEAAYVNGNVYTPVYLNYSSLGKKKKVKYSNRHMGGRPDRIIWLSEEELELIPTMYLGDKIIIQGGEYRPDAVTFERFFDGGWTFGMQGLSEDDTGRFVVETKLDKDEDKRHFFPLSEAFEFAKTVPDTSITLDKIGGVNLRSDAVSDSGTVNNLEKDRIYDVEIYIGTKSYETKLKADSKILVSRESFETTEYTLENSNVGVITVPNYLVTGYYLIDGVGLIRFINSSYGTHWDDTTNFNMPIVQYDGDGTLIKDPSEPEKTEEEFDDELYGDDTFEGEEEMEELEEGYTMEVQ